MVRLTRERDEALEREKATTEVLRVISSSTGALEPVFEAMLENAARICEAKFGVLFRFDGEKYEFAADIGTPASCGQSKLAIPPIMPLKLLSDHLSDSAARGPPSMCQCSRTAC